MVEHSRSTPHYLERELYERVRSKPEIFDFLERGSLDGIWYWDLENPEQEWMSARFWELLGYDSRDKAHLASEWQGMVFPDDLKVALENLEAHLADPIRPYDQIVRYRHKDGSTVWVRCRGIAIRDAAGRPIRMLGAHNDVTALKRAEERMTELNASLEGRVADRTSELERVHHEKLELQERFQESQRMESLALLAGGVAHDFNNLLMVILGNAEVALDDVSPEAPIRDHLERVQEAGEHAARLTQQLLIYAGRGVVSLEPTDVSDVVASIRDLLEASVRGLSGLEVHLAENLPPVQADSTQLRQVVFNLVTNACEALDEAGGRIRVSTGILHADQSFLDGCVGNDLPAPGAYVFLEVSDTGSGIDPMEAARLFEPFYTTKFTGRGLGLAVVRSIVNRHSGAIRVAAAGGSGTTITVLLPTLTGTERVSIAAPAPETEGVANPTILVVDDDDWVREIAEALLLRAHFRVVTASGGVKAVEILTANPGAVDAVLLDLSMPEMNGEETFQELRRLRGDLPIVLATGHSEEVARARFSHEGLSGLLLKPYKPGELVAAVRRALPD